MTKNSAKGLKHYEIKDVVTQDKKHPLPAHTFTPIIMKGHILPYLTFLKF